MFNTIRKYWEKISPEYRGIVFFLIALFSSNFIWKLTISGTEIEDAVSVTFLWFDVSGIFRAVMYHSAYTAHVMLDFFGVHHILVNNVISFANGNSMSVITGCTAIKQVFIACCIFTFSRGPWLHKLWYVPLALVFLACFNIVRLFLLSFVVRDCVDMFEFYHAFVLKYVFYGVLLVLWYIWDEYLRIRLS
ncbi:MAG: exosortase/archaeosortase family protein [Paludibacteraceae bacterium]|nr:exosortase/archaeosortase family protein [Paludibacteraceae bacterium]